MKGNLPWQGLKCKDKQEKYLKIKELKESISAEKLCEGLPVEFSKYLNYCYDLQFDDEPNYKSLVTMFRELYKSKDYENDYLYDWITVKNNTRVLKEASICHSYEYSKAQNQIDKKFQGNEFGANSSIQQQDTKVLDNQNYKKIKSQWCTLFINIMMIGQWHILPLIYLKNLRRSV